MSHIQLLAAGRRSGKTTQAFAWVSQGVPVPGYPGWSRVLVVPNIDLFNYYRRDYWERLEDYDHRVYFLRDWVGTMRVDRTTEVCIDDLDMVLGSLDRVPGRIVAATMTTEPWEPQTFRESPRFTDDPLTT